MRLGDKTTLEKAIYNVIRIPLEAFRGAPLSDFNVDNRIAWIKKRTIIREEDIVYSLFGIFDV